MKNPRLLFEPPTYRSLSDRTSRNDTRSNRLYAYRSSVVRRIAVGTRLRSFPTRSERAGTFLQTVKGEGWARNGGRGAERREKERDRRFDDTFVGRIWRRIDARERRRCNPAEGHRTVAAALPAATTPRPANRRQWQRQLLQLHAAFTTVSRSEIITGVASAATSADERRRESSQRRSTIGSIKY